MEYKRAYCIMPVYKINSDIDMNYKVLNCVISNERERYFENGETKKEYQVFIPDNNIENMSDEMLKYELSSYYDCPHIISEVFSDIDIAKEKSFRLNNERNKTKKKVLNNNHFGF